jgi:putative addiction module antidote
MAYQLKVRKIGNSYGVVLPKEALATLRVKEGDTLTITEAPHGLNMTASNPDFDKTMRIMEDISQRYRNALRELAK